MFFPEDNVLRAKPQIDAIRSFHVEAKLVSTDNGLRETRINTILRSLTLTSIQALNLRRSSKMKNG
jgi:hypothetical protein